MLIDAHAHLDHYDAAHLETARAQIAQQRVFTVAVAMDPPSYARTKAIAAALPDLVLPAFGVHPWEAPKYADDLAALDPLLAETPLIGEIGLDAHWITDAGAHPAQRRVFAHCLAAARDQHKIVNLHTKGAEMDVLEHLRAHHIERAIVHWYSGGRPALRALIAYGCYFTVGVEIMRSNKIRTIAQLIPEDRLLTETDNPGGWSWLNDDDAPGMPALVADVVAALAEVRDTTPDAIRATVRDNLLRLFAGDPHVARWAAYLQGRDS